MASLKTPVLERLFFERYDEASDTLSKEDVSLKETEDAIRRFGPGLSTRNPANFVKDIVRTPTRNRVFPPAVVDKGWTMIQETGDSRCFRFVRLPPGQTTAFLELSPPSELLDDPHPLQSLSLAPSSRRFGRRDETWLTHVATNLNVVHTHLALNSEMDVLGLELLQSNVKLGSAEIDAIYLLTLTDGEEILISCEMKGKAEVLDTDQIGRGAESVGKTVPEMRVMPMGVKGLGKNLIWVVEFDCEFPPLHQLSDGIYEVKPPVQGLD